MTDPVGRADHRGLREVALLARGCAFVVAAVLLAASPHPLAAGLWLVGLVAAGTTATRLLDRTSALRAAVTVEAALAAVGILATAGTASPLFPYLLAPTLVGGLLLGNDGALLPAGAAGVVLFAGLPLHDGPLGGLATDIGEWVLLAALVGLLAAWLRRLLTDLRPPAVDDSYASAYRLLSQLRTVARQLSAGLDPVTLADGLLAAAGEAAAYDRATVLVRSGGERLVPLAFRGADRTTWSADLHDESPVTDAWLSQEPQVRPGLLDRSEGRQGSSLVVPLRFGVRTFGVVGLERLGGRGFSVEEAQSALAVCDEGAPRLETALLFDEIREVATAEERRRLAREIHDGIAQELASVGYVVDSLTAEAAASESGLADPLRDLRAEITRIVRELRLSIYDLRSDVDRHGGLGAALSEQLRAVGTTSRLTVHLSLDEQPTRLPAETEAELLRVAQEAITNARKHADADNLWVTCVVDPPYARLVVEDDGMGLVSAGRDDSFGLEVMRERAARLRATLRIQPRRPRGTTVELQIGGAAGDTLITESLTDDDVG